MVSDESFWPICRHFRNIRKKMLVARYIFCFTNGFMKVSSVIAIFVVLTVGLMHENEINIST